MSARTETRSEKGTLLDFTVDASIEPYLWSKLSFRRICLNGYKFNLFSTAQDMDFGSAELYTQLSLEQTKYNTLLSMKCTVFCHEVEKKDYAIVFKLFKQILCRSPWSVKIKRQQRCDVFRMRFCCSMMFSKCTLAGLYSAVAVIEFHSISEMKVSNVLYRLRGATLNKPK